MAYARAINPRVQASEGWSWRVSTPGLLAHAVKTHGLGFIPNQVLPPLIANVGVGAVLYTSYLQFLGFLHDSSSQSKKRVYPPPPLSSTFTAGFLAGSVQSVIAAPLDALQVRFKVSDMLEGQYETMWSYGRHKLSDIGLRGVCAGWTLSFIKESLGYGVFFATFEYVKQQSYYGFVTRYYGANNPLFNPYSLRRATLQEDSKMVIKPHYGLEPFFLLLAGMAASVTQQVVQAPLGLIQNTHYGRLESLDYQAKLQHSTSGMMRNYYHAYLATFAQCQRRAGIAGGWRRWLYRGFLWNTIKQVPSTSAGLIVFELVRRRYGNKAEAVRMEEDGYDILLS